MPLRSASKYKSPTKAAPPIEAVALAEADLRHIGNLFESYQEAATKSATERLTATSPAAVRSKSICSMKRMSNMTAPRS